MPVPKAPIFKHKVDENEIKLCAIEDSLNDMGYLCDGSKSVIKVIEDNNLDKSQFDFPYGSFDKFKESVEQDAFNEYGRVGFLTKSESDKLHKDISEGKIWITY